MVAPSGRCACLCVYVRVFICMHVCKLCYVHTCTYTHIRLLRGVQHRKKGESSNMHTYIHTYIHTCTYTLAWGAAQQGRFVQTYIHTYILAHINLHRMEDSFKYACIHTHRLYRRLHKKNGCNSYAYISTYIHTQRDCVDVFNHKNLCGVQHTRID